ncbi:MAG: CoA pyrophosphatase [Nitratireductor sp.]|nr:CoA pyrophosphatase [Nitratireductor sp.]MCC0022118.1 CoA pyrophosphatase [Nitratireductor sp.]
MSGLDHLPDEAEAIADWVSDLDGTAFRRLAGETLLPRGSELDQGADAHPPHGDFAMNPEFRDWVFSRAQKPAAVLIPVIERPGDLSVLLTRRTEKLSSHSGQVAFPGGKIDLADKDAAAAALREAEEEVALNPALVEVLGQLPQYLTGSGYQISPVVALVDPGAEVSPNPGEVAAIFEVPLSFLMDTRNHRRSSRQFQGKERFFLEMPFGEHYIWGVTAGIIRLMHDRMIVPAHKS